MILCSRLGKIHAWKGITQVARKISKYLNYWILFIGCKIWIKRLHLVKLFQFFRSHTFKALPRKFKIQINPIEIEHEVDFVKKEFLLFDCILPFDGQQSLQLVWKDKITSVKFLPPLTWCKLARINFGKWLENLG